MKLDKIITLANKAVELRFLAMIRSLRAVGCQLPVIIIPYDDQPIFDLPEGCQIWRDEDIFDLLKDYPMGGVKRKYVTLTLKNYHFVDSDVVFLKNPEEILKSHTGFVTCCGHWRSTDHIATPKLSKFLRTKSSLWQKLIFNSGQYASDQILFEKDHLIELCKSTTLYYDTLEFPHHEQPGLNFLVHSSKVEYKNLTLPPFELESSWAGDYLDCLPDRNSDRAPYLIHWAGMPRGEHREVDQLFLNYLTADERNRLAEEESTHKVNWQAKLKNLLK